MMKRTQHANLATSICSFIFVLMSATLAISADPETEINFEIQNSVEVTGEIHALKGWAYSLAVHPTDGSVVVGGQNAQVRRIIPK